MSQVGSPDNTETDKRAGRVAHVVADTIRERIKSGQLVAGQYLANVRAVGDEFGVSPETARRALQALVRQHWLTVQPGHGFRVTAQAHDPATHAPIAFIIASQGDGPLWRGYHGCLLASIHRAAATYGWSVLGLGTSADLVERICAARVSGLLVDTPDTTLIARLQRIGLPVVLLEERLAGCDAVAQDNHAGMQTAVQHLTARGCRRIAWFGACEETIYSRARWAGALAELRDGPAHLVPDGVIDENQPDAAGQLAALIACERVDGILAPWATSALAACRVVEGLGRDPRSDLPVVGWSSDQMLADLRTDFQGRPLPALVTWNMDELATCALARLAERRRHPGIFPVNITIGMRLRPAETGSPSPTGQRTP